jgi:hypothetical protein
MEGMKGLEDKPSHPFRSWNSLLPKEKETVVEKALCCPEGSPRQIEFRVSAVML